MRKSQVHPEEKFNGFKQFDRAPLIFQPIFYRVISSVVDVTLYTCFLYLEVLCFFLVFQDVCCEVYAHFMGCERAV